MKNQISGYIVKIKDNCSFNENDNGVIFPSGKFSLFDEPNYQISTTLFGVLCSTELIGEDDPNNITICEVDITDEIGDMIDTTNVHMHQPHTKLNEIGYETFYNYISSNVDELIKWINKIINNNTIYLYFDYDMTILFTNLYLMNIYKEYIIDIAKNNTYTFSNELLKNIKIIEAI